MNLKKFSEAMSMIDDKYIEEAESYKKERKPIFIKYGGVAACVALVLTLGIFAVVGRYGDYTKQPRDEPTNTSYNSIDKLLQTEDEQTNSIYHRIDKLPQLGKSLGSELVYYTEEEIFSFNSAIFKGTISDIYNIEIDSPLLNYGAIVEIKVEKVYRGFCSEGDTISVLVTHPLEIEGYAMEDSETVSRMRVGMTGIFKASIYDEDDVWTSGDGEIKLALKDIADYGFGIGAYCAFLETEEGLYYASYAYPGAAGAQTLDDIEEYVKAMIEKVASDEYKNSKNETSGEESDPETE